MFDDAIDFIKSGIIGGEGDFETAEIAKEKEVKVGLMSYDRTSVVGGAEGGEDGGTLIERGRKLLFGIRPISGEEPYVTRHSSQMFTQSPYFPPQAPSFVPPFPLPLLPLILRSVPSGPRTSTSGCSWSVPPCPCSRTGRPS